MATDNRKAWSDFRRMILWIALAGVLMVAVALWYLSLYDALYPSAVFATIGGVFISTLLGCGLFAAAFFSDKSGHDADVTGATHHDRSDD
jgi:drug/metabolite transporter superfamily protein YnfA